MNEEETKKLEAVLKVVSEVVLGKITDSDNSDGMLWKEALPIRQPKKATRGIVNPGNLCYIIAGLQLLNNCTKFVQRLEAQPHHTALTSATVAVFRSLHHSVDIPVDCLAKYPKDMIDQCLPSFSGDQQQDSHEFILKLFGHVDQFLSEEIARLSGKNKKIALPTDTFRIKVKTWRTCCVCKESYSPNVDQQLGLNIELAGLGVESVSVSDAITFAFAKETFECQCKLTGACSGEHSSRQTFVVEDLYVFRFVVSTYLYSRLFVNSSARNI